MNEENSLEQQAKAKDAEIERLRNIVRATEVERDAGDQVCDNLRAEIREKDAAIERLKALLAECADVLGHYALLHDFEKGLIQRAREGTK